MACRNACVIGLVACHAAVPVLGAGAGAGTTANPIRKVVTMIQNMQGKVKEEEARQEKLYDAAMCQCETQRSELDNSIDTGKSRIEAITAMLKSGSNALEALQAQLAQHVSSRDAAKADVATATNIRNKEASAFAKEKSDLETNLAALKKAVSSLEAGMGGSFLQTSAAEALRQFAMEKADMPDAARQDVLVFLSGSQQEGEDYAPQSGEITGILKQMGDQMQASLKEVTETENAAIQSFQGLTSSKAKEIELLQTQIEAEMMRVGEAGVGGAGGQNALDDAKEQLQDDKKLLAALEKSCAEKTQDHKDAQILLAQEEAALADTVKMLNSDETLELFKKALPPASSSFLQVRVSSEAVKGKALSALRAVPRRYLQARPEVDFLALALEGKQKGFEEVLGMIDNMLTTLKQEQSDDDDKKSYCNAEFDKTEDEKKVLQLSISDSETAMDELKGRIAEITDAIKSLQDGIRKLDMHVEEATDQRKMDHADYKELTTNNALAKEVLLMAKNRLAKFYKPTFAQVSRNPGNQNGGGVIDMIDNIIKDVDRESQEAEVVEKNTQQNFEDFIAASGKKRKEDTTAETDQAAAKAEAEEALQVEANNQFATRKEFMNNAEVIVNLHKSCDWLLEQFDARREARTAEIEAIEKAKAVLNGADYALLQTSERHAEVRRVGLAR